MKRSAGQVLLYDTTLRDGTQREGLSLSVEDKLRITRELDELGVQYIEGGWPGSNPKDAEYFERARKLELRNARVTAFGSTRHARNRCEDDPNLQALVAAETPVVALVGKTSMLHVERVLETTGEENLRMISESVAYLKGLGREVVFDAEHFFDGYRLDAAYAVAAASAGASGSDLVWAHGHRPLVLLGDFRRPGLPVVCAHVHGPGVTRRGRQDHRYEFLRQYSHRSASR